MAPGGQDEMSWGSAGREERRGGLADSEGECENSFPATDEDEENNLYKRRK